MYIELKMQIVSLLSTRHRSGNNMHTLQLNLELHENRYVQSLYVALIAKHGGNYNITMTLFI